MSEKSDPPIFSPVTRDALSQKVAKMLTDAIMSGKLKPGARVSESVIARDLGVSRAPVREAGRLLESAGLLVSHPNRGFFVRTMDSEDLDSLYELRLAIECEAAARLARQGAQEVIPVLRKQMDQMIALASSGEIAAQVQADMHFHRLMIEGCGNRRFVSVFKKVASEIQLGVALIGHVNDAPDNIARNHEMIIAALEAGDEEAARAAMRYHIGVARTAVVAHFQRLEAAGPHPENPAS
ncbi:GntR family transcriptional regulator [Antarcticimicrobium sediminis]|uniref:GntR family transcriptional regulator n=1 Tax=Antarcticimicrobium sediminis TaxID=2546227 RepID=A0A4R5ET64_9RHOB|nr:GntR family transcriptional regulator [Antarcticimicrobium sediminis]TDE37890.1 GntR family transcriptional regulator [Antarcticimicrobium sediminis]